MNPPVSLRRWTFLPLLSVLFFPSPASALVMRENGPEPVIVQIKETVRLSDQLDDHLDQLASRHNQDGLQVVKRWAGSKFLILLSFPTNFTRQQALTAVGRLEQLPAVEKVVPVSAFNLHFRSGDFLRAYDSHQAIPDAARRGLDADRIGRPPPRVRDQVSLDSIPHVANRLIVRWKDEHIWRAPTTGFAQVIANLHRNTGCRVVREIRYSPTQLTQVLEFDNPRMLAGKLRSYIESGFVVYAQPDFIYKTMGTRFPDDPWYLNPPGPQWTLPIISAPEAWYETTGNSSVIIAVGDTGANVSHPDLSSNISGAHNFITGTSNVDDDSPDNHGSAVASIIGAIGEIGPSAKGITGVAWDTSLLILKIVGEGLSGQSEQIEQSCPGSLIAQSIRYSVDNNASAINLSVGKYDVICDSKGCYEDEYDRCLFDAMRYARDHQPNGMVVVSAAGNGAAVRLPDGSIPDNNDRDINRITPSSIPTINNISVLATDRSDHKASYSSYGKYRVDLAAPGGEGGSLVGAPDKIPALKQTYTLPLDEDDRNLFYGTSAAAPHVSGALALIKSKYPWESFAGIRDRVLMGTDLKVNLQNQCRTSGRLNLHKALQKRSMFRNLSTRARVEGGDKVMIGGFVIGGSDNTGTLKVCIRGIGPSLPGVNEKLGNPRIELHSKSGTLDSNNDWQEHSSASEVQALGFAPSDSREAAMIKYLPPGAYTVVLSDEGSAYGVGVFDIFELENNSNERTRLLNISTRCLVGTDENVAIAGTYIGDQAPPQPNDPPRPNRRVLMFGKGPSLFAFGGNTPYYYLSNPQIRVAGTSFENFDWMTFDDDSSGDGHGLEEELQEAHFAPAHGQESALWPTFTPGVYTVILSGENGTTGVGLLELYEY